MDYDINYLMEVLNRIQNNPYGIRHTGHYLKRATYRDVDLMLYLKNYCLKSQLVFKRL